MSWVQRHAVSERYAAEAHLSLRAGNVPRARELYNLAAEAEEAALPEIDPQAVRTLGIAAVSVASLWYKAAQLEKAQAVAHRWLALQKLPLFAADQLRGVLEQIWTFKDLAATGMQFTGSEVLVSVAGGEIVRGGAPLDLILQKVEQVSAMFYRAAEMLLALPHRKRGAPCADLREACRPWLFQSAPGSYQFAVRVQRPRQAKLFPECDVKVEQVSRRFLDIVKAVAEDPQEGLQEIVPDVEYRETFLKLTRNLSPTGKSCTRVSFSPLASPEVPPVVLRVESREGIRSALKEQFPRHRDTVPDAVPVQLRGVLRALHLDEDWLEITVTRGQVSEHVRVKDAGDEVDDTLGPLVNHEVVIDAIRVGNDDYRLRDIQPAE
jgi:hypothetical protein